MEIVAAPTHLEANLRALGERNDDLRRRLSEASAADGLVLEPARDGALAGSYRGRRLASAHEPRAEGERLAARVDVVEHATVVVLGFGLGWHVRALARRLGRSGLIVVVETDLALLRAVLERIDHSAWLAESLVLFVTDPADRAALGQKLAGGEPILGQGVTFLEHPASRARLGEAGARMRAAMAEQLVSAKTTLLTTLVRSVETVRNVVRNLPAWAESGGVADLAGAARGRPAIVISAGPSLARNIDLLAAPEVRERCVLVAAQTTLKPLLARGVRPHFVTALDYHEISRRFYEGLDAAALEGVTLVVDPKAHPEIPRAFAGPKRFFRIPFLDRLLGDAVADRGTLPAGATVAHLSLYLAHHLGCDPIALVGQDLGFPDGLYYAPRTAIHDVWAPELGPFNSIAMMEWQRIVRHRGHLHKREDVHGRSIYTDTQMVTYLHQFERDFARLEREGVRVLDATEGGVRKLHAPPTTLAAFLAEHARTPLPELPAVPAPDGAERRRIADRVAAVRAEIATIRDASRRTRHLLQEMLAAQSDPPRLAELYRKVDRERTRVERHLDALRILDHLNQLGAFKRARADRRIHLLERDLSPAEVQRAQIERDVVNVQWLQDAGDELLGQLDESLAALRGRAVAPGRPEAAAPPSTSAGGASVTQRVRAAAVVPIDPERSALGGRRALAAPFAGRPVLRATLEALDRAETLDAVILLVPPGLDVTPLLAGPPLRRPVLVEPTHPADAVRLPAIAAGRRWMASSWRGGLAGLTAWDEALRPHATSAALARHDLTAAVVVGADWPLVRTGGDDGIDALVRRHREHPDLHRLVFTQAPPGLGACLASRDLVEQLAAPGRLATLGALVVYQPAAPQADPIARDANVQIDHRVRDALVRAAVDGPRQARIAAAALERVAPDADGVALVAALAAAEDDLAGALGPAHLVVELTSRVASRGRLHDLPGADAAPIDLDPALAERLLRAAAAVPDLALTLGAIGDPLLHPDFDRLCTLAAEAGVAGIHVRTALPGGADDARRLARLPVEIASIELHADTPATYRRMHGRDAFMDVLAGIQALVESRSAPGGLGALAVPWIVPRLRRCAETHEDLDAFFERWQHLLGTAVIDPMPTDEEQPDWPIDPLTPAVTPPQVLARESLRRMLVRPDGSVPLVETDLRGRTTVATLRDADLAAAWSQLVTARRAAPGRFRILAP